MSVIAHRELRNNSASVLRRVEAGESFTITNGGREVAVLTSPGKSVIDQLVATGQARPARRPRSFTTLPEFTGLATQDILDDLRGDR